MTYFAVRRVRGPAWNASLPMRAQTQWAEHAAFMNALAAEGFVVLGGPLGSGEEVLSVEPWTILLDAGRVEGRG